MQNPCPMPATPPIISCTIKAMAEPNDEVCCVHLWHAYFADFDVSQTISCPLRTPSNVGDAGATQNPTAPMQNPCPMASRPATLPIIACTVKVMTGPNDEVCYVHLWHAYFADFDVSHRQFPVLWGPLVMSAMQVLSRTLLHPCRIPARWLLDLLLPP